MKFKHYLKIVLTGLSQLAMVILGLCVIPPAYFLRKDGRLPSVFLAWGNDKDGLYSSPDHAPRWIKPGTFIDAYYWLAIRNPARNFSAWLGFDPLKARIEIVQFGVFGQSDMQVLAYVGDKTYPLIYQCRKLPFGYTWVLKMGWKNWQFFRDDGHLKTQDELEKNPVQFVFYPQVVKHV